MFCINNLRKLFVENNDIRIEFLIIQLQSQTYPLWISPFKLKVKKYQKYQFVSEQFFSKILHEIFVNML